MARALLTTVAAAAGFALLLGAAPAWACEGHQPEAKPALEGQGSVMDEVDHLMAAKCSCSSAADCTCKKGACKCPKCGGHQRARIFDRLKGKQDILRVPQNARRDATAGVFI